MIAIMTIFLFILVRILAVTVVITDFALTINIINIITTTSKNNHHQDFFCHFSAKVEQEMKQDRYFHSHYRYYVREMRILGYSQLLESYRSLTLQYMANAFGVSEAFIDRYALVNLVFYCSFSA